MAQAERLNPPIPTLAIRLADALFYLHKQGLVHFDVKPANLGRRTNGSVVILPPPDPQSLTALASQP